MPIWSALNFELHKSSQTYILIRVQMAWTPHKSEQVKISWDIQKSGDALWGGH